VIANDFLWLAEPPNRNKHVVRSHQPRPSPHRPQLQPVGARHDIIPHEPIGTIEVLTATTTTNIVGMGMVIIRTKQGAHRISPVWYIPELTTRLLSLGQFLQSGLSSRGSARAISLYMNEKNVLSFYPRSEDDTIYVIDTGGEG
jgi:hypothetical protein